MTDFIIAKFHIKKTKVFDKQRFTMTQGGLSMHLLKQESMLDVSFIHCYCNIACMLLVIEDKSLTLW